MNAGTMAIERPAEEASRDTATIGDVAWMQPAPTALALPDAVDAGGIQATCFAA
jgi:hypothetical protein